MAIVAGAAGEKVEFGFVSTGVSDDLHAATKLARRMVTSFGMSEELGPVTIGEAGGEVFLGASLQDLGSVGPATLELIDSEVERLVGEAEEKAIRCSSATGRRWPRPRARCSSTRRSRASRSTRVLSTVKPTPITFIEGNGSVPRAGRRAAGRCLTPAHAWLLALCLTAFGAAPFPGRRARKAIWRLEQPPPPAGSGVQGRPRAAR